MALSCAIKKAPQLAQRSNVEKARSDRFIRNQLQQM
jgi:hypothetical protein